ncbi:MAG: glycosyltransferase [Rikenellaceae bacterium]
MKKLTLIIATYNRALQVLETLSSVIQQDADPSLWECIVVNNNSSDDTISRVSDFIAKNPTFDIRLVTETRQGLSHARNCGMSVATTPLFAIIDDDELIVPKFISSYINFFDSHPDVAVGGGAIVAVYRSKRPKWISKYTEQPIANPMNLGDKARPFPRRMIPGGGNMAIRRSAIEKHGAFDPELGRKGSQLIGGEENNLFERLRQGGEQIWWVPGAEMHHLIPDEKLERSYLNRLWFNIGVSHSLRAKIEEESGANIIVLEREAIKWVATLLIALLYMVCLAPSKSKYLILMRYHISRGILSTISVR